MYYWKERILNENMMDYIHDDRIYKNSLSRERNISIIIDICLNNASYNQMAKKHNISLERVRQILVNYGIAVVRAKQNNII